METDFPFTEYGWSPLRAIQSNGWKFIRAPSEELYDLNQDPDEKINLMTIDPVRADELQKLLTQMEAKMDVRKETETVLDNESKMALQSLGYIGGGGSLGMDTANLRDPKNAVHLRSRFITALSDCRAGKSKNCERALLKLIQESPESYAYRYEYAKLLYHQRRFEEAQSSF